MTRRRQLLAALGTGVVATAGCRGALTRSGDLADAAAGADGPDDGDATDGVVDYSLAATGRPADVCERPIGDSDIVAIERPAFGTEWPDDVGPPYRPVTDGSAVVGVALPDGRARAYPLSILAVNEIVNDDFGGPLLVSFCPLCRSGFVADRTVAGEPTVFDVTGTLWQPPRIWAAASEADERVKSDRAEGVSPTANLVMYDRATESYWSQLLGQAICGPQREERLRVRAFEMSTWGAWRDEHPDSELLLPPPHSTLTRPGDD
ncbi:DUF3179 domain-containing (seleno)protein [Halorubellus litoreus]|uniref:DUF3179 domain-containing (Seleno)protein n=1 Tax=Halorubellus litoreus TaxID=755308 RepID=A0ABD5VAD4_9EURY